jgi:hypothetical protein
MDLSLLILMSLTADSTNGYSPEGLYQFLKGKIKSEDLTKDRVAFHTHLLELIESCCVDCTDGLLSLTDVGRNRLCSDNTLHYILERLTPFKDEMDRIAKLARNS